MNTTTIDDAGKADLLRQARALKEAYGDPATGGVLPDTIEVWRAGRKLATVVGRTRDDETTLGRIAARLRDGCAIDAIALYREAETADIPPGGGMSAEPSFVPCVWVIYREATGRAIAGHITHDGRWPPSWDAAGSLLIDTAAGDRLALGGEMVHLGKILRREPVADGVFTALLETGVAHTPQDRDEAHAIVLRLLLARLRRKGFAAIDHTETDSTAAIVHPN